MPPTDDHSERRLESVLAAIDALIRGSEDAVATAAALLAQLVEWLRSDRQPRLPAPASRPLLPLTQREIEIARLVCQGLTSEAIAHRFVIARSTIDRHRANIHKKIGASERADLEAMREVWDKP